MIRNTLNQIQFAIRRKWLGKISLRRGLLSTELTPPHSLISSISPVSLTSEKECGYYQLLLSRAGLPESHTLDQVVDIGCRNWSYSKAIADFFPNARITGIEVDGARRYWNLYRRMDFANFYAGQLCRQGRQAQFWCGDFLDFDLQNFKGGMQSRKTVFCFFFPFVSENPCLSWGLPVQFVNFSNLLRHARTLASKASQEAFIVSAHQGEWEAEEARRAYSDAHLKFVEKVVLAEDSAPLWPSPHDTHLFECELE